MHFGKRRNHSAAVKKDQHSIIGPLKKSKQTTIRENDTWVKNNIKYFTACHAVSEPLAIYYTNSRSALAKYILFNR